MYKVTRLSEKQTFVDKMEKKSSILSPKTQLYTTEGPGHIVESLSTALEQFRHIDMGRIELLHTENLHAADPGSNSAELMEAEKKEIKSLIEKGTRKVVIKEDVLKNENLLNRRFTFTIKYANTENAIYCIKQDMCCRDMKTRMKTIMCKITLHFDKGLVDCLLP